MLNPIWLQTFKTLVDTRHFTKTAEKLFMTQPGVTQHIRKLEQACQQPLIHRINKSFELTDQGRLVYEYATQLAKNEHYLLEQIHDNEPFSGSYRIACSGSLSLLIYPQLLAIQQRHPKLRIELEAAPNHRILSAIKEGQIDIGIVTSQPSHGVFDSEVLGEEPLCLVLPHTCHPNPNELAECLHQLGLIRHPDIDHYLSLYLAKSTNPTLSTLHSESFAVAGYVNQIQQILLPVAQGLGFTVLPKSALESFLLREQITVYQNPVPVTETLYLVKKRQRDLPQRFANINQQLKLWIADYSQS
ncbi:LysR family transcriptional regulator [Vibrio misgurnus]|uniref:LysR family transcriptional regulator n=1 Tax=Vibrio misgurnus TaxID=2993714 RepID=UPI0023F73FB3|nr:LysR family transcriptional regulator [Vibrio sp. VCS]